jgi:hypothetical protein
MNKTHATLFFGILLILLGAGVYLAQGPLEISREMVAGAEAAEAATERKPTAELADAESETAALQVVTEARTALVTDPEALLAAPAPEPGPPTEKTLRGRVLFTDREGVEHSDSSGQFELVVWKGNQGSHVEVEFMQGHWNVTGPEIQGADRFTVANLAIEAQGGVFTDPELEHFASSAEEFLIRVRAAPISTLRVVQEGTGVELSGISLVRCEGSEDEHPGRAFQSRLVASDLRSPIDLSRYSAALAQFGTAEFLVGAKDHAWKKVRFDLQSGGERVLALMSSAALAVSVEGVKKEDRVQLRLLRGENPIPVLEIQLQENGEISITDLEPGSIQIQAAIGPWWKDPIVLGQARAELEAGRVAHVPLMLAEAPVLRTAAATGLVLIAEEWETTSAKLSLDFLGTILAGRSGRHNPLAREVPTPRVGFRAFQWSDSDLQVGRYELSLSQPAISTAFDLPEQGLVNFEWTVGPPRELLLRIVDAKSGSDILTADCNWHPVRPEGVSGGLLQSAPYDQERGGYVIRTPAERIELMIWTWPYQPFGEALDLSSGLRQHSVQLEPASGITLKIRDGETPLAFPGDWSESPAMVDGEGRTTLSRFGQFERKFMVSAPGSYTIELPDFAGYRQAEKPTILIPDGEFVEYIVQLERE